VVGALDSPAEGRVVVAGQDITRASRKELFEFRRHGVSFVFQTFNLFRR
jgi:putative ABC transport system ATP-binding protein